MPIHGEHLQKVVAPMVLLRIESNFYIFASFVLDIEVHSLIFISLHFLFSQGLFFVEKLTKIATNMY